MNFGRELSRDVIDNECSVETEEIERVKQSMCNDEVEDVMIDETLDEAHHNVHTLDET